MPRLEQKEDGDYYIRAYSHASGCVITWQVSGLGYTFLNKHGIYEGNKFSFSLLQKMISSNLVYTGGSGIHPTNNFSNHNRSIMSPTGIAKPLSLMKNSYQIIRTKNPQISNSNIQRAVTQPSHPIGKTTSLVFRKYKKRWELLIVFPKLLTDASKKLLTNSSHLTVVGSMDTLKAKCFQSGISEASIPVRPQAANYELELVGSDSSCHDLWSFLEESVISIGGVKGLNLSGTVFQKHMEALPLNEGFRLDDHEVMVLGESYYVVFHKADALQLIPDTLIYKSLGEVGVWETWGIQLPKIADKAIRDWITWLGYSLN